MKIALVHDFLREYGGAERVVEAMHELWPDAPLYTSFVDWPSFAKSPKGKVEVFKSMDIRTSWVQGNWFVKKFHSPLRFLAPVIWNSFDLSSYDVVLSSSGWFMCRGAVKGTGPAARVSRDSLQFDRPSTSLRVNTKNQAEFTPSQSRGSEDSSQDALARVTRRPPLHICYIHHPPRNLYGYATGSDLQKYWPVRVYASIVNFFLRHYDFDTAQRVDYFIANSKETARRVMKFYRRESTVIYPPVEIFNNPILKLSNNPIKRNYYLSVGRLTYSKRVDLAIKAANQLKIPLKIVGTGKEEVNLKKLASQPFQGKGDSLQNQSIEFLGAVSDEELARLYAGAKALIFCALDEDFGMVPVEAMAAGVPVIGLGQGGVLETIVDGTLRSNSGQATGILFSEPTVVSLLDAVKKFIKMKKDWSADCHKQAEKFSKTRFQKQLQRFIEEKYTAYMASR